ncbi:MAG: proton-conducting transporter membrane subunit [Peptococcaceae bacterium]|nr:proton-conducting transporter membrane subunit [Peptococcaceae bacterium]
MVINLGLYGAVRVILGILGGGPAWWGLTVTGLGVLSALFGMLYAVIDDDLKRVLAFSSVENMGLIFIALGMSMVFSSYGLKAFAALGLLVALFHAANHASYKGLLFLGAGAVERATGEHRLDALGGLLKRMPVTGLLFLVGSLSIAAIPPTNGFVSEWLLFQTALQSFRLPGAAGAKIFFAVAAAALALTAGLAVTCFVRAFGIAFLGLPRTSAAREAAESPGPILGAMGLLAAASLGMGLLATALFPLIDRVNQSLYGVSVLNQVVPPVLARPAAFATLITMGGGLLGSPGGVNGWVIQPATGFSSIATPFIAIFVVLLTLVPLGLTFAGRGKTVPGKVWDGGRPEFLPTMQYTAEAYSNPIRMLFGRFYRLYGTLEAKEGLPSVLIYRSGVASLVEDYLYRPLTGLIRRLAEKIALLQSGSINLYLCYIFVLLVAALVASRYFS